MTHVVISEEDVIIDEYYLEYCIKHSPTIFAELNERIRPHFLKEDEGLHYASLINDLYHRIEKFNHYLNLQERKSDCELINRFRVEIKDNLLVEIHKTHLEIQALLYPVYRSDCSIVSDYISKLSYQFFR